jgi:Uma2 family endonuclease
LYRSSGDDAIAVFRRCRGNHYSAGTDGTRRRFRTLRRLPCTQKLRPAKDILLIIEIADSSVEYDRDLKAVIYAESQIPEYWLADLTANVVSRYSAPEGRACRKVESYRRGDSIAPTLLPSCVIAVDALLTE